MDLKELQPMIVMFVAVGFLIAIGIIAVNSIGISSYTTETVEENITAATSTAVALANDWVLEINEIVNATNLVVITPANYTLDQEHGNVYWVDDFANGWLVEVDYDYRGLSSDVKTATDNVGTELGAIASSWLGLIITIAILSVVILLVVRSFGGRTR